MRFSYPSMIQLVVLLFSLHTVSCSNGTPNKLRRYKICNGAKCKAIGSFNPPNFLQEMDSFLYSRWTRWATCTRHCTTNRYRACKFPLICGNTVIHEEAFCYHRGTYCEYIFENNQNQRDFFSDDTDYLASSSELGVHSDSEKGLEFPQVSLSDFGNLIEDRESVPSPVKTSTNVNFNSQSQRPRRPRKPDFPLMKDESHNNHRGRHKFRRRNDTSWHFPSQTTTTTWRPTIRQQPRGVEVDTNSLTRPESAGSFPVNDYDQLDSATCGVARITDRNRNGIATRILGGQETKQGRWPWQVAVLNQMNEAFCGGTLISPRWILTAAHCIRKKLLVTVGEHHLHQHDGTEKHYQIEAAFIHPDFDHETVDNDIALLLLPEPVPTQAGLACLPHENQVLPKPGTVCTILGWGKERHTHVFGTTVLHEGKVPLVSNGECRYTYGHHEITDMFCAGYRGGTVDSCAGDSGGPILCSVDSRWTVFGVTSFGDGCGRKGKFGIYSKVPNYVGWINKVMKANEYAF